MRHGAPEVGLALGRGRARGAGLLVDRPVGLAREILVQEIIILHVTMVAPRATMIETDHAAAEMATEMTTRLMQTVESINIRQICHVIEMMIGSLLHN